MNLELQQAFLEHNFAPPVLRRDIAVLGLLHKRVIGSSHPSFADLFSLIVFIRTNGLQGEMNMFIPHAIFQMRRIK